MSASRIPGRCTSVTVPESLGAGDGPRGQDPTRRHVGSQLPDGGQLGEHVEVGDAGQAVGAHGQPDPRRIEPVDGRSSRPGHWLLRGQVTRLAPASAQRPELRVREVHTVHRHEILPHPTELPQIRDGGPAGGVQSVPPSAAGLEDPTPRSGTRVQEAELLGRLGQVDRHPADRLFRATARIDGRARVTPSTARGRPARAGPRATADGRDDRRGTRPPVARGRRAVGVEAQELAEHNGRYPLVDPGGRPTPGCWRCRPRAPFRRTGTRGWPR